MSAGVNDWALVIGPGSAGYQFTVPAHTLVTTDRGLGDTPLISASAPVCVIGTGDRYGALYLQRRGMFTAYFVSGNRVSVVRIVVTPTDRATINLGLPLIVVGVLVGAAGGVLAYRRRRAWSVPPDLRRADDAERGEAFDPEKAQRAAWDAAVDQTSGIY